MRLALASFLIAVAAFWSTEALQSGLGLRRAAARSSFGSSAGLRQLGARRLYAEPPSAPGGGGVDENPTTVNIEEETKKYGFEVGMWKSLTNKDAASIKPGDLLKKYGAAYLVTSISLAIVSFALCYVLISTGVDVASLLKKVGIESSATASNFGTAGLAYAVHKAASPIRFPPTVALTPVVANWLGRKGNSSSDGESTA